MNIFEDFQARIAPLLRRRRSGRALCRRCSIFRRFVVEPPREAAHGDLVDQCGDGLRPRGEGGRLESARARRRARGRARRTAPDVEAAEVAGPGFINIRLKPAVYARRAARRAERRRAISAARRSRPRARSTSNMSAPIRPGRCMSATRAARCSATRWPTCSSFAGRARDARILHQRRRRAGRRARALGVSALSRSARRDGSTRSPRGFIPATISSRSARRWRANSARRCATSRRPSGCRRCGRARSTAMMAMIRDDLAALNIVHEVFSSERALTGADGGEDQVRDAIEDLAQARHRLRRPAAAAQGPAVGGLGGSRADAVPLDRIRRRRRPAADQVGRRLHLFRQRHRLSQEQDRSRLPELWSTSGARITAAMSSACRRRSRRSPAARPRSTSGCVSWCG